ncbi:CHAT domain protein [Ceratobasidium sp. AG-Ba]|nr:CHAT domain protein [Ceratobasidium sp. AG-Ba]QRW10829.1 CHAT domain protein [Ceratobasidium sp. AG-Ba]
MKRRGKSSVRQRIARFQKTGRSGGHEEGETGTTRNVSTTSHQILKQLDERDDDDWAEVENESTPLVEMASALNENGSPINADEEQILTFEDFARIAGGVDAASADARVFERIPWVIRKLFELSGTWLFRGLSPGCKPLYRAVEIAIADGNVLDSAIGGLECCRDLVLRYGKTGFWGRWRGRDPGLNYWLGLRAGLSKILCELGYAYHTRFLMGSKLEDAEVALACLREGVTKYRTNLDEDQILQFGKTLLTHYYAVGKIQDLDQCIDTLLTYADAGIPYKNPVTIANIIKYLAEALCARAERNHAESDARMSLLMSQRAVNALPKLPGDSQGWLRAGFMEGLSRSLLVMANLSKESKLALETITEAVAHFREALEMRKLAGAIPRHLGLTRIELGVTLLQRFRVSRTPDDLDAGISELRIAEKELGKANDVDKAVAFSNLGIGYRLKSLVSANVMDINLSVVYLRKALRAVESSSAQYNIKATYLSNLASSLLTRYRLKNLSEDLEECVQRASQAVELVPPMHTLRYKVLDVFSVCVNERSWRLGDMDGLRKAVDLMREVLGTATVPSADRVTYTINLAILLVHLANATKESPSEANDMLEDAIGLWHSIQDQIPPSHPLYLELAGGLSDALFQKYVLNEDPTLLNQVVDLRTRALELVPDERPDRLKYQKALADALISRYRAYSPGNPSDLETAIEGYATAIKYVHCPQSIRYACSISWVNICVQYGHPSSMEAFEFAVEMYRRLAFVDSNIASRVDQLSMHDTGITSSAARFAIERGQFERAVELLEYGRATFWQQHVAPRTTITKLQSIDPLLASKMADCWRQLEENSSQDLRTARTDEWEQLLATDYRNRKVAELSTKWECLVKEAESVLGPTKLSQRPSFEDLHTRIDSRLVVVVNVSQRGCDALMFAPQWPGVRRLELSKLNMDIITVMHNRVDSALRRWGRSAEAQTRHFVTGAKKSVSAGNGAMYEVLRMLWDFIVEPIFSYLQLTPMPLAERPRIWWLLTGPLSQVPLHAAGPYDSPSSLNAGSYAMSSYIPTLSVLSVSDGSFNTPKREPIDVLAVAVPTISYLPVNAIPATKKEVESIKATLESAGAKVNAFVDHKATTSNILQHLSSSSIAHFACHGMQDIYNPIRSALLLYDEALPLTRIATGIADTTIAPVAILSACSTARGDINLLDESLHIAAAFLFIGFRAAVATLWSIDDQDAPLVFREFYSYLCEQGTKEIGLDNTSRALAYALEVLRDSGVELERWLPFVHLGT